MRTLIVTAIAALIFAPSAFAQGGSPSQAFSLSFDKQFNGDTSRQPTDNYGYKTEFTSVTLKAGDYLTVDWSQPVGGYNRLAMLPPDANDNNWTQVDQIISRGSSQTGADEFKLSIIRSGTYYFRLQAQANYGGAYSIIVHVRRGIRAGDIPSAARLATSGHLYHGDVSTHIPDNNGTSREFWKVLLHAGNRVGVSWSQPTGGQVSLYLLPVGTSNGNYTNQNPLSERGPSSNGRDAFSFVATRSGLYYLDFYSSQPGAYAFKLTIRHR